MLFSSPARPCQSAPPAARRTAQLFKGVGTLLVAMVLSFAVVSIASAAGLSAITDVGGGWVQQTSGTTDDLSSVCFTDSSHGWAVGMDADGFSTILATTDGGVHWVTQMSQTPGGTDALALEDVFFTDSSHGWAVGDGTILATTDGGAHWVTQTSDTPDQLLSVFFTDSSHGWAVGLYNGPAILATTDGGAHWVTQIPGVIDELVALWDVTFTDSSHGWAVGDGGTILATTDGGAHWVTQTSRTTQRWYSVCFTDSSHGWAVGDGGTILATTDGGAHWAAQNSEVGGGEPGYLYSVCFTDSSHGWAVGSYDGPVIYATADGGAHWKIPAWVQTSYLRSVFFTDSSHGWAVGDGGTILHFGHRDIKSASIVRTPNKSSVTYGRKHGAAKFTLSAVIKGWGSNPIKSHNVYLQASSNGKFWSNTYKIKTTSTGKASKAFKVTSRRVRYYRWYVPAKSEVCLKTYSKTTKVTVK